MASSSLIHRNMTQPTHGFIPKNILPKPEIGHITQPFEYYEAHRRKLRVKDNKRGRPRSDSISSLIEEGHTSRSSIRCPICQRVFPREKSLQAHHRTHTGERPYICDFPGCERAFCQGGQLKTHQRLHTGEKPFKCSAAECYHRFTHSNRHCPAHPHASLERIVARDDIRQTSVDDEAIREWLAKQSAARQEKTPSKPTPDDINNVMTEQTQAANQQHIEARRRAKQENKLLRQTSENKDKLISAIALIELAQQRVPENTVEPSQCENMPNTYLSAGGVNCKLENVSMNYYPNIEGITNQQFLYDAENRRKMYISGDEKCGIINFKEEAENLSPNRYQMENHEYVLHNGENVQPQQLFLNRVNMSETRRMYSATENILQQTTYCPSFYKAREQYI